MRILIAILLLCSSVVGEDIFKPTGRYAAHSSGTKTTKVKRRFVAMFTATYCGPCQNFKRFEAPKIRARFGQDAFKEYEMTESRHKSKYGSRIKSLPTFVICDWETGAWIGSPVVGYTAAEVLIARLDDSPVVRHQPQVRIHPYQPPPSRGEILTPNGWQGLTLPAQRANPPNRYINWPGWGTIDLQTYNRNCNCPMCQSIRAQQQEYQRQLREYQRTSAEASLPDDQKPCPMETVNAMLDAMQLRSDDVLADLGCGDGRILIAAARRGIRGIGVELDHSRAVAAKQAISDAGVSDLVTVEVGDARKFDTSRATAITAYLYPTLLAELAPKMAAARVSASPFHEVPGLTMVQHGDVWIYRKQSANPGVFGITGTSHESRETLIFHLLNDGVHRGRWNLQSLHAMSDEQLISAHDRDHTKML